MLNLGGKARKSGAFEQYHAQIGIVIGEAHRDIDYLLLQQFDVYFGTGAAHVGGAKLARIFRAEQLDALQVGNAAGTNNAFGEMWFGRRIDGNRFRRCDRSE